MPRRWILEFGRLAVWLTLVSLAGFWFGRPAEWVLGGVLLYLAVQLLQLYRLERVLSGTRLDGMDDARSVWWQLSARIDTLETNATKRKNQYLRLLREVRQSTDALEDGGLILTKYSG